MTSIKDVADAAQVSTATVSRALSNPDIVSLKTRNKIFKAVEQTGYVPNALARNFRRKRSDTALILIPDISNIFFADIVRGIEHKAISVGYQVLIGDTQYSHAREVDYYDAIMQRKADGIISLGRHAPFPPELLKQQDQSKQPAFVAALEYGDELDIPLIGIDNKLAAYEATNFLLSHNHKDIAFLNGPEASLLSRERYQGHKDALAEAGIKPYKALYRAGDFTAESGRQAMQRLLASKKKFTAVFVANDEMAFGAIHTIHEAGLRIPDDISIIGFDDIHFSKYTSPPLTTVHQPRFAIGETCMDILIKLLNNEESESQQVVLPHKIIERKSVKTI